MHFSHFDQFYLTFLPVTPQKFSLYINYNIFFRVLTSSLQISTSDILYEISANQITNPPKDQFLRVDSAKLSAPSGLSVLHKIIGQYTSSTK
jgi:hypothetical protein